MCFDNCFKSIVELGCVKLFMFMYCVYKLGYNILICYIIGLYCILVYCFWYLNYKVVCVNRKIVFCGMCNIVDVKFVCM